MNKIPHSSKESEALLRSLLPAGKEISVRPMFGNLAAFVGGNMSVGLYGEDLFLRLSDSDRAELLENDGAAVFEPMKGRQMKEYIVVPRSWKRDPAKIKPWVTKSFEWSSRLPAKKAKR
ncbi:MAG TPA: TfoX/Sxy family protein [Nitrososphaerales archaeon]|nr:TfoX/Sxy family protein [Nitrososphaerales archaeon]